MPSIAYKTGGNVPRLRSTRDTTHTSRCLSKRFLLQPPPAAASLLFWGINVSSIRTHMHPFLTTAGGTTNAYIYSHTRPLSPPRGNHERFHIYTWVPITPPWGVANTHAHILTHIRPLLTPWGKSRTHIHTCVLSPRHGDTGEATNAYTYTYIRPLHIRRSR